MLRRAVHLIPVLAVSALALGVVSLALAGTKTLTDRKGDSKKGQTDIKSVSSKPSRLSVTWTIQAYGEFSKDHAPCVEISTTPTKQPRGDNFNLCGNGRIDDFKHGTVAGHARVRRPNNKTIIFIVSRRIIGVSKISWAIQVRYNHGCFPDLCDQAPEGPGTHVIQVL